MTLTPEELRSKVVDKSNNLPSKFGGKNTDYYVMSGTLIKWNYESNSH